MASNGGKKGGTFEGTTVYLSRNLVAPEIYSTLYDALRLNGADVKSCCDPSKNSPTDFHVISSPDHEKFAGLRAKHCNLLGPQCVLSCAKERRVLPKQGYTCCLAMDGVKVLASGFEKDEKVRIQERVSAMGGLSLDKRSPDIDFVIVKSVLAVKYKWALNVLKKPVVSINWLDKCWTEHRIVPHEPYRLLPFTGLTISVTRISLDERRQIGKLIVENGGQYSSDLTKKCTHLVSDGVGGDKYTVAKRWGNIHIVNRRWIDMCIARRACLDEAAYHVTNNLSSHTSSASYSQKEKQSQHVNIIPQRVSTTTNSVELPEPFVSQNVSVSIPCTVFNELDKEDKATSDIAAPDFCVADDSEDGDDLYLSECRISLVGFTEKEMARLVSLVRRGGGTRHVMLSHRLTHIIVGAPSEAEKKEVRRLASFGVINIVKVAWLEECHRARREVDVLPIHVASDLIVAKDPINGISTNSETSTGTTNSSEMESLITRKRTRQSVLDFGSKPEKSDRLCGSMSCSIKEGLDRKFSKIFDGKRFCFSASFPHDQRGEIIEWVERGGGIMIEDPKRTAINFLVEIHGLSSSTASTSSPLYTVVTTHWIRSCLEEGSLQDVRSHILFSPLKCRVPLPGFEKLKLCSSLYEEKEKLLLKNLCFTLGAKFSKNINKTMTHLVCKFAFGPKYEFAIKHDIQVVTAEWIFECVAKDAVVTTLDEFRPRSITSQDREEGLCPVTQHHSQGAKPIVDSQTQLTSHRNDKQGNSDEGIHEKIKSMSTSKRLKPSGQNVACEEVKGSQKIHGNSGAISDVAEAIEDLLAQSTMIQDSKPREQLGCERNIFTTESSVAGQDRDNTHSIGISGHWLNKTQNQCNNSNVVASEQRNPAYDAFSETQSESQIVEYEEDLSGRQKLIDRVRSQSSNPLAQ